MFAFPHKISCLDLGIVKDLADSIDGSTRYACCARLGQPFLRRTMQKLLLYSRYKPVAATHSLRIRSKSGIYPQIFASAQLTQFLVTTIVAAADDNISIQCT